MVENIFWILNWMARTNLAEVQVETWPKIELRVKESNHIYVLLKLN